MPVASIQPRTTLRARTGRPRWRRVGLSFALVALSIGGVSGVLPQPVAAIADHRHLVDDYRILDDVAPGDGVCATSAATCTVRAALQEANATPAETTEIGVAADLDPLTAGIQATATVWQGTTTGISPIPVATFNPGLLQPMRTTASTPFDPYAWNVVAAAVTLDFENRLAFSPVDDGNFIGTAFYFDHADIVVRNFDNVKASETAFVASPNADRLVLENGRSFDTTTNITERFLWIDNGTDGVALRNVRIASLWQWGVVIAGGASINGLTLDRVLFDNVADTPNDSYDGFTHAGGAVSTITGLDVANSTFNGFRFGRTPFQLNNIRLVNSVFRDNVFSNGDAGFADNNRAYITYRATGGSNNRITNNVFRLTNNVGYAIHIDEIISTAVRGSFTINDNIFIGTGGNAFNYPPIELRWAGLTEVRRNTFVATSGTDGLASENGSYPDAQLYNEQNSNNFPGTGGGIYPWYPVADGGYPIVDAATCTIDVKVRFPSTQAANRQPTSTTPVALDVFYLPATSNDADVFLGTVTAPAGTADYVLTGIPYTFGGGKIRVQTTDSTGHTSQLSRSLAVTGTDACGPTTRVEQAPSQSDPTSVRDVRFRVTFSSDVPDGQLTAADFVTSASTASGVTVTSIIRNSPTDFTVVARANATGTIVLSLPAGAVQDGGGLPSTASTSIDNSVTYVSPLSISPATMSVSEPAGSATYMVTRTGVPQAAPVTITPTVTPTLATATPNPLSLAFLDDTFSGSVVAIDNTVVDGTRAAQVSFVVTSTDPNYDGLLLTPISLSVLDDDQPVAALSTLAVSPDPATGVPPDGLSAYTLTATARNADGLAVQGATVTFAAVGPQPQLSALSCVTSAAGTCSVTATSTAAGTFPVTASIGGAQIGGSPASLVFVAPDIDLEKVVSANNDADGSGTVSLGDELTFQFQITNTGNIALDTITVTDDELGLTDIVCGSTPLAPSASTSCTAPYVVGQPDVDAGVIVNMATATGVAAALDPVSDTDTLATPVPRSPAIQVVKSFTSGPGPFAAGDPIEYDLVITNTGNVTLTGVSATDAALGLVLSTCGSSSLAPGVSTNCTGTRTVTQVDLDDGQIANTASTRATSPSGGIVTDTDDDLVVLQQSPQITVLKSHALTDDADTSGSVSVGDTVTFSFTVTNSGDVTLESVVVSDELDGLTAVSCPVTTLAPGADTTCSADYTVTQTDVDAGRIDNTASVAASSPVGADVDDAASHTVAVPQTPDIALVKSFALTADNDSSGDIGLDDVVTYSFAVTNTGDVTLDAVAISDPLPGLGTIGCPATPLAPGAQTTCTATYAVDQADVDAGRIDNTATATAESPTGIVVTDSDSRTATLTSTPSITIDKTHELTTDGDGSGSISLGDELTYSFEVANTGDVTLDAVTVTDPQLDSSPIPCLQSTLAPAATTTCTATYTVIQIDVDTGEIINTARVDGESPLGVPVTDDDTDRAVVVNPASIALTKSVTAPATWVVDTTLTYSFEVVNTGDVVLTDVAIDDRLFGITAPTCPSTTLAPDQTVVCSAAYTVTQPDIDAGEVTNVATVSGTPPVGVPVTATDDAVATTTQDDDIDLQKTGILADADGDGRASDGDVVAYSFTITNTGNTTLESIAIADPLAGLSTITCAATVLASAEATTCSATYSIDQDDVDAGQIVNTATAVGTPPAAPQISDEHTFVLDLPAFPGFSFTKQLGSNADEDASNTVSLDDTLTYRFDVTNTGNVTLDPIVIDDGALGVAGLACGGPLAPAATATCNATRVVSQSDVDAGQILNTATATATPPTGPDVTATASATVPIATTPDITMTKSSAITTDLAPVAKVSPGDTLTYSFAVTNAGDVTIGSVSVADSLEGLSVVSCPAGSLAPGGSLTCTATYAVDQADVDTGSISNIATASALAPGGVVVSDDDSTTIVIAGEPAIELTKSVTVTDDPDGDGVSVGDELTYVVTAINDGDVTLSGVEIDDPTVDLDTCGQPVDLAPGDSHACTASHIVTADDVDAGRIDNTATVTATPPSGPAVSDSSSAAILLAQQPGIQLDKSLLSQSGPGVAGDELTYQFETTNTGNVTLTTVAVSDPTVGVTDLVCSASLAAGASATCTATYTVTQDDVDAGVIVNTATVSARPPGGIDPVEDADAVTTETFQDSSLTLDKALAGAPATIPSAGDVLDYRFVVTNTGTVTLSDVSVADPQVGSLTCPALPVPPSASVTCTAEYTVTQNDIDAGTVVNTATASAVAPASAPVPSPVVATSTTPLSRVSSMTFDKSFAGNIDADGSGTITLADTVTYGLVVTNTGNVTLQDLTVTDPLAGSAACPSSALAPAEAVTCTASLAVTQDHIDARQIVNTATAAVTPPTGAPAVAPASSSATIDVAGIAALTLDKRVDGIDDRDGSGGLTRGDGVRYAFTVANTGTVTLASVSVDDPMLGPVACPVVPLAPAEIVTCHAAYTAGQDDIDAGQIANTATATGVAPAGYSQPTSVDSVVVPADQIAALHVDKTIAGNADEDLSMTVSFGDTLTYRVAVTNTGTVTLTGITVDDAMLTGLSCDTATLAPDAIATCSGSMTVTQATVDAGVINNTAAAAGDAPVGSGLAPATGQDTVRVQVPRVAALDLAKVAMLGNDLDGTGTVTLGDVITYEATATNTGNVTITGVTISDQLPGIGPLACTPGQPTALGPGEAVSCRADHTVVQADVDVGSIVNVASVSGSPPPEVDPLATPDASAPIGIDRTAGIDLTKAVIDGPATPRLGDQITYSYSVTNTGTVTLGSATVDDAALGVDDLPCGGSLGPGDAATCMAVRTLTQADVNAGAFTNTAVARGAPVAGSGLADVTDGDTATVLPAQHPSIALLKSSTTADDDGSGDLSDGDVVTYTFTVTNNGDVDLTGVQITDELTGMSPLTCASSQPFTLAPAATTTCTATYSVTQENVDDGGVLNSATATGTSPGGLEVSDEASHALQATQIPAITLIKTTTGGTIDPDVDDLVPYTFEILNTGNVTLSGVALDDPMLELDAAPCGASALAPGASTSCTAAHMIVQADIDTGSITNSASVTGTPPTGPNDAVADTDTSDLVLAQSADVALTKSFAGYDDDDGDGAITAGDTISYDLTAVNEGTVTLTGVAIGDALIGVNCSAATLPPGGALPCSGTYIVSQDDVDSGTIHNTADSTAVFGALVLTDTDDEIVAPSAIAASDLSKTVTGIDDIDASGSTSVGDLVHYLITFTNTGTVTLGSVDIDDNLDGISALDCSPSTGPLAPGDQRTCTATYVVTQAVIDGGFVENLASAAPTAPPGATFVPPPTASVTIPIQKFPGITISKSVSAIPGAGVGDVAQYSFIVTNTGNSTLIGVEIDDPLAGMTAIACPRDTIAPTESINCTSSYTISQGDVDRGVVDNSATVAGRNPTVQVVADADSASLPLVQSAALSIEKTGAGEWGDRAPLVGDVVQYSIVVTNVGGVTLDNVAVSDPLPGLSALVCSATAIAPGAAATCTGTYSIVQADIDAGQVVNTATASADGQNGIDPVGVSASATVAIRPAVSTLSVSKSGETMPDGRIRWQIDVANEGPDAAIGPISIDDALPPAVTANEAIAPPGWTCEVSAASVRCEHATPLAAATIDRIIIDSTPTATGTVTNEVLLTSMPGSNCSAGSTSTSCSARASVERALPTVAPPPVTSPSLPDLPQTGTDVVALLRLALLLLAGGTALVLAAGHRGPLRQR